MQVRHHRMKPRKRSAQLACLILALPVLPCLAQNPESTAAGAGSVKSATLELFEAVETSESRTRPTARPGRESRVTTAGPEFTLLGVSRLGDKYSAILQDKEGDSLIVRADLGTNTQIPNHRGYAIVDVTASSVAIRYPGNNPCVEFNERGVSCNNAANIAELVLANGEPIAAENQAIVADSENPTNIEVIEPQADPSNPFEALRNGRRGNIVNATGAEANTSGRFTPRRINPADVPEGKRIVATPFGDRLVDE
jgi:hypothetical protein